MAVQSPPFGLLLKRHRVAGGMTQEELAEARRGAALMMVGRRQEARAALEAAIALAEATGDLATATVALDHLGEIARDGGDYHQSQQDFARRGAGR
jgi:hypothetical protein